MAGQRKRTDELSPEALVAASEAAQAPPADAPATVGEEPSAADVDLSAATVEEPAARTVRYVVTRPLSAGEVPEVVTARVVRQHEDPDVLDLAVGDEEVTGVRRSERRHEPGTWHEEAE